MPAGATMVELALTNLFGYYSLLLPPLLRTYYHVIIV